MLQSDTREQQLQITQMGALTHVAVYAYCRRCTLTMNLQKLALIRAAESDSCISLMPTIRRRSLTQTGTVVHASA